MKLFKIDDKILFEKHFANMNVRDFLELSEIPRDIDTEQMRNLGNFLNNIKKANPEYDISEMTIGKLLEEYAVREMIENGEV